MRKVASAMRYAWSVMRNVIRGLSGLCLLTFSVACNSLPATAILDDASVPDADAIGDATIRPDAADDTDVIDAGTAHEAGTAAHADAAIPDAARDVECPNAEIVPDAGDTCAGFGTGESCNAACGLPPYGYVCTNGGPPGFAGCKRVSSSALLGGTYCCPDLKCVRVMSQDSACDADAGADAGDAGATPLLYQCATTSDGGLVANPAPGCREISGLPVYRYFCCASYGVHARDGALVAPPSRLAHAARAGTLERYQKNGTTA